MAQGSSFSALKKRKTEGEEESRERLPLESEELLSQLAVRQGQALREYRSQVAALQLETSRQRDSALKAEKRAALVVEAWTALNAALLSLRAQLAPSQGHPADSESAAQKVDSWLSAPSEATQNRRVLFLPVFPSRRLAAAALPLLFVAGALLFADSSTATRQPDDSAAGATPGAPDVASRKAEVEKEGEEEEDSDALDALLGDTLSRAQRREQGLAEQTPEGEDGSARLQGCRRWTLSLFGECLRLALEKPAAPTPASAQSPSTTPCCERCLQLQAALLNLRMRAGAWRSRAKLAEREKQIKTREAAAAELEAARLRKKILLLSEDAAGSNSVASGLARLAASPSASIEELGEKAQTAGASTLREAEGDEAVAKNPPQASADGGASSELALQKKTWVPPAGEAAGAEESAAEKGVRPTCDKGPSDEADFQREEEVAALTARLAAKEKTLVELEAQTAALRKVADEATFLSAVRRLQVLRSPPFLELQQLCAEKDEALAARCAEVDDLRRELLAEQNRNDQAFDEFLKTQEEARKQLSDRVSSLKEEVETLKAQNERFSLQLDSARLEVEASKRIQEEVEKTSAQRTLQLAHVRLQCEQLREAGKQMLARNERLKKEKQQMIEALRSAEDARVHLSASAQKGSVDAPLTASSACESHKAASAATDGGGSESSKEAPAAQLHDGGDVATEAALLRNEVEALRRQLAERKEVDSEVAELRTQYGVVSEELEEVSKAFEERQSHCEHLIRQLKARDDAAIQQKTEADTAQQQLQYLQRINRLQEQKLLLQKQHLDQVTANARSLVDGVQGAVSRAGAADTQCAEISNCFQAMRVARDQLFKEKEELSREVQLLQETKKATEASLESHQEKLQTLQVDLRRQREARAEAERRLEKLREKQERQDKRRLHSDAGDAPFVASSLLREENENMRRRLICSVCNERFKDHMLLKCGHIFCRECIDKNVKARNRKCPHCKSQFDQRDIRKVYLHN